MNNEREELLREVMLETGTTQSDLSRLSGVRQPSISGFLSGRVELSDEQLDRLLSCMGRRLEVVRRPVVPAPDPLRTTLLAAPPQTLHAPRPRQLRRVAADGSSATWTASGTE